MTEQPAPCPGEAALAAFVDKSLRGHDRDAIERHLHACEGCRETVACVVAIDDGDPGPHASAVGSTRVERPRGPRKDLADPTRGDTVGRFVLLDLLGVGGMGLVYAAYDPQLDRKVAIKLLRAADVAAGANDDATARLLREAQAMAKINHPNVIKIHDVGAHGDEVYLAMELADAGTVRAWLASRRSLDEIIDVFVQAGRGLAAAHAAGLIHRDFKPDNVLRFSDGRVCVTDFGLVGVGRTEAAPAVPATSPLTRSLTHTGAIMGTPWYMAPEQFAGDAATASTDQFAFCVALHEALYGAHPFGGASFEQLAVTVSAGVLAPAPDGGKVPAWLRRVVVRGLAVAPADRFPSMASVVDELAGDRRRRRRWLLGAAAGALGVAAIAAGLASVLAAGPASSPAGEVACDRADAHLAAVWNPARRGQLEAAFRASPRPHAAATFARLAPMIDAWGRAWVAGHRDACEATHVRGEQSQRALDLRMQCLTERLGDAGATLDLLVAGGDDVVDHALDAITRLPSVEPCANLATLAAVVRPPETAAARAQVQLVTARLDQARAAHRLGRYAQARDLARPALAAARAAAYDPLTADALIVLGEAQLALADRDAVDTLREATLVARGAADTASEIAASADLIAALTTLRGSYELALEIAELAAATARQTHPSAELVVKLANARVGLDLARGKLTDAHDHAALALATAERALGPDHPAVLTAVSQLANVLRAQGQFAAARTLFERVLATRERVDGPQHPDVAGALDDLGNEARTEGKLDEAKGRYDRALAIRTTALGPDHPAVAGSYNNLGTFDAEQGDLVGARRNFARAIEVYERVYGPDNVEVAATVTNLGNALVQLGQLDDAKVALARARTLYEGAHGPDDPHVAYVISELGVIAEREGKLDDALARIREAKQLAIKALGADHPEIAEYLDREASVLDSQHQLVEAEAVAARAIQIYQHAYGADHPRVAVGLGVLAGLQAKRDEYPAALATWQRSLAIFEATLRPNHPNLSFALAGIGDALTELRRGPEAVPYLERALQIRTDARLPPSLVAEIHLDLAAALVQSPATRRRAIDEARTALALYVQAKDDDDAREARAWLAAHR